MPLIYSSGPAAFDFVFAVPGHARLAWAPLVDHLLQARPAEARGPVILNVVTSNPDVPRLYQRLHFTVVGGAPLDPGQRPGPGSGSSRTRWQAPT